jgi:hypothetical protein
VTASSPSYTCPWADCWCRQWPPLRYIQSLDLYYTMGEKAPGLYHYDYLPDGTRPEDGKHSSS